jgi:hypothetical protein
MWPLLRSCEWNQKRKGIDMKRIVDLETVTAVLLADGKWHDVRKGSFRADGDIYAEGDECDSTNCFSSEQWATWIAAETQTGVACSSSSIKGLTYIPRQNDVVED